jgi:GT2 family glycosyltransferase
MSEIETKLSIIVTNHKNAELLKLCLDSVKRASENLSREIFVLDAEAEEETEEIMADSFGEIKYVPFKENTGYSKLVNAGLAEAQGEYILILNGDMVIFPDALEKMLQYMQTHEEVGILAPQLLNFNGTIQESCFRFYKPETILYRRTFLGKTKRGKKDLERFSMKDFDFEESREVDWVLGAALMIRRDALNQVGPMDERFFMYFEDVDWCKRFWNKGWKVVYYPEAKMHHYHGRMSRKSNFMSHFFNRYAWIHLSSGIKYFLKHKSN